MRQRGARDNCFKALVYRVNTQLLHLLRWCNLESSSIPGMESSDTVFCNCAQYELSNQHSQSTDFESLFV